ncbi:MAG: hypothetical protein E7613_09625 [Ruminococcaceae bacterium]|nr:hypothetical protein [Oscillospiraceae bacterium]
MKKLLILILAASLALLSSCNDGEREEIPESATENKEAEKPVDEITTGEETNVTEPEPEVSQPEDTYIPEAPQPTVPAEDPEELKRIEGLKEASSLSFGEITSVAEENGQVTFTVTINYTCPDDNEYTLALGSNFMEADMYTLVDSVSVKGSGTVTLTHKTIPVRWEDGSFEIAANLMYSTKTGIHILAEAVSPVDESLLPEAPTEGEATSEVPEAPVEAPTPADPPLPVETPSVPEGADAGQEYIDSMVFIGDSTTHGMIYYGVLSGGKNTKQVWTPKSGTLAMWNLLTEKIVYPDNGTEMLIGDAIAAKKPDKVVLTLGVNGVSSLSETEFKKYYNGLIEEIKERSPETKIILQSIYPVCDYYQYVKSISMEKINRANTWISQLAEENGLYYLNTISVLLGDNGYLKESYCNGDGIHISGEGFKVILDYIRTHPID